MDQAEVKKGLDALESWWNQLEMYRLMIPELRQLFTLNVEGRAEAARLEKQNAQLREENARLKQEHQQNTERAVSARAQADTEEARVRNLKEDHAAFRAAVGL